MRGYNRNKADLGSFVTPSKSREQIAAHIAAGFPSPVEYRATARNAEGFTTSNENIVPVHLRRAP